MPPARADAALLRRLEDEVRAVHDAVTRIEEVLKSSAVRIGELADIVKDHGTRIADLEAARNVAKGALWAWRLIWVLATGALATGAHVAGRAWR